MRASSPGISSATKSSLMRPARRFASTWSQNTELLVFYCAGRRLHLGERARGELALLQERSEAARLGGALSLGEIGHSLQWGCPLFHNAALVCCRWGGP